MKKNRITLIIVVALLLVAVVLQLTNKKGSIREELKDFAVEDTSAVTKIFMVDKSNAQVLLERKRGCWQLNGEYTARQDAIDVLLKTINRVAVKAPVSKSSFETVVKLLSANSTKVEIFNDDELIKTYYVGGSTQNQLGTYMMMENSSVPFIMHIEGFNGYLSTRYFTTESEWRDRSILRYQFNEIASVAVEHPSSPEKSFKVSNLGSNKFALEDLSQGVAVENFDTIAVKTFLAGYKKVHFENFVDNMEDAKRDSILSSQPINIYTIEDVFGNKKTIKTFRRSGGELIGDDGEVMKWDPDRAYGYINENEFVIIQYYVLDPLTTGFRYFLR